MSQAAGFDVLGFGAVAVDDLLYVGEYPPPERKVRVHRRLRQCGGLTGTALVAAARLGARCGYAGLLGPDELSRYVIDALGREGIDLDCRVERPDARPAHSTIIVDETHHTRTIFSSLEGPIGPDPVLPEESLIRRAAVVLIDHHGLEGTLRIARIARAAGVRIVADFERRPGPPFDEILALVDHLVLSDRFAGELTAERQPDRMAAALWNDSREAVIITSGSAGCWCLDASSPRPWRLPAFRVEVVDTTGCGDVFHGAYAAALAEGLPLRDRVTLASAAAALKATRPGGQSGIPTRAAVLEHIRQASG